MKKNLIINADDFGLNNSVNKAIIQAFDRGYITQTSIMANMPGTDEVRHLILQFDLSKKTGVHLNLTFGEPLTEDIKNCNRFCDNKGYFKETNPSIKLSDFWLSKTEKEAVHKEFDAQIKKVLSLGVNKDFCHIDSHHQIHTKWEIGGIVIKLARKNEIKKVRIYQNMSQSSWKGKTYRWLYNSRLKYNNISQSKFFGSPNDSKFLSKYINSNTNEVIEIMVHPQFDSSGKLVDFCLDNSTYPEVLSFLSNPGELNYQSFSEQNI